MHPSRIIRVIRDDLVSSSQVNKRMLSASV